MKLKAEEIATAVQAQRLDASGSIVPSGYSIDSRTLAAGECFIAIQGPNFDGHEFIGAALRQGAALVIARSDTQSPIEAGWPVIRVDDTLSALQRLANFTRRKWGKTVIAITGSTGKTTTKEMTSLLLQAHFRIFKSVGNFNNDFGLPLSILKLADEHEIAVLELGMSRSGEIQRLSRIAEPNIGVVTNVRPVHLENFRSMQGIALTKRELIESLPADGVAVLNNDDRRVRKFGRMFPSKVLTFGVEAAAAYRASEIRSLGLEGQEFRLDHKAHGHRLRLPLIGEHNVHNALPAIAVAHHLGIGFETIRQSLSALKPAAGRGELLRFHDGFAVLNDSYNSNPAAMDAVVAFLKTLTGFKRKILVAGEMLELGPDAEQFHRDCGKLAAAARIDRIIGVRGLAEFITRAAQEKGRLPAETPFFADSAAAGEWLTREVTGGDFVVVKGSRGVRTEQVIEILRRDHALAAR
ncbi:MAG: UDP-N-acetylmuramoyl-tripeptide--D-alanyl-D-alanine ligase [Acidobacteria bacterium]|nr:UDP-N-acetylmuramoyl-tripeptide--D-alanyl-D-alanine ligase [Acidobacteriota bacterium]